MSATAKASDVTISGAPLGVYLAAPDGMAGTLQAVNAWLRAHSHILTILLTVAGIVLIGNGIYGLA